jgi:chemotaxis protein CheC
LARKLTALQIDALREAGNIGAGNAAMALSSMVNRKIMVEVPQALIMPLPSVPELAGGPERVVAGVYLRVTGEAAGSMLLLLPEASARLLVGMILPGEEDEPVLTEMARSALQEIGTIITGSYLTALGTLTGMVMKPSVPAFALDMAGAVVDLILVELAAWEDEVLVIETAFELGGQASRGHIIFFPDAGSLDGMLARLGVA